MYSTLSTQSTHRPLMHYTQATTYIIKPQFRILLNTTDKFLSMQKGTKVQKSIPISFPFFPLK